MAIFLDSSKENKEEEEKDSKEVLQYVPSDLPDEVPTSVTGWSNDLRVQNAGERYLNELADMSGSLDTGSWFGGNEFQEGGRRDIAEVMRDEAYRIETILSRNGNVDKLSEQGKKDYRFLRDSWDKTKVSGSKETWDATKDIATDMIASPISLLGLIFTGGTGNVAAQTVGKETLKQGLKRIATSEATSSQAVRGAITAGTGSGVYEDQLQRYEVGTDLSESYDIKRTAAMIGMGATAGATLTAMVSGGSKAAMKRMRNDMDVDTISKKADELSSTGENPEVNKIIDEKWGDISISGTREIFLESVKERLLSTASQKITRGNRKKINAEILELRTTLKKLTPATEEPTVKGGTPTTQKIKSIRHKRKEKARTLEERKAVQDRIDSLNSQLDSDTIGRQAEADLSRAEQGIVPSQFKAEYDKLFEFESFTAMPAPKEIDSLASTISAKVGGGEKTTEEIVDVVNQTVADNPNKPLKSIQNKISYNVNRYVNRYGSKLIFKPVAVIESFAKDSATARELMKMFRYDAGRTVRGKRTREGKDFFETYQEKLGGYYVRSKVAMEPLAVNMKGKLSDLANKDLARALRGQASENDNINLIGKELRAILDDIGDELEGAGLLAREAPAKITKSGKKVKTKERIKDYFPRAWDRKAIEQNQEVFKQKLVDSKQVNTLEEAQKTVTEMLDKQNQLGGGSVSGSSFFSLQNRAFDKINDNDFEDFLDSDVVNVMNNYIFTSSKQLAKEEVFGVTGIKKIANGRDGFQEKYIDKIRKEMQDSGKTLTKTDEANILQVYKLTTSEGVSRFESNVAQGLVDTYGLANRLAYLPLATVSSVTEIMLNVSKAGGVRSLKGFVTASDQSFKTISSQLKEKLGKQGLSEQEVWKEMNKFGIALDTAMSDVAERLSGEALNTQLARNINNVFFKTTLLDQWTKFVQMSSFVTGKSLITDNLKEIAKHAKLPDSKRIVRLKDQLSELNVDIDSGVNWVNQGSKQGDEFYTSVQRGAARYTNEVILQPSPESGLKPVWLADPKTSIIFQFLGYPAAFTNTILKGASKSLLRNPTSLSNNASIISAGLIMTEMARWANYARSGGESEKLKSREEIYGAAINRTGLNSLPIQLLQQASKTSQIYQNPIAGIASVSPLAQDFFKLSSRGDIVSFFGKKVPFYGAGKTVEKVFNVEFMDEYNKSLKETQKKLKEATVKERLVERPRFNIGGEVSTPIPNAPAEPDERINKLTGLPYNEGAGTAYMDQDDPMRRMNMAAGGKVLNQLRRNCYSEGSHVKKSTKNIFNVEFRDEYNKSLKEAQNKLIVNDQVVTSSDIKEILKVHPDNLSSEALDIVQHLINNDETFAKKWREHTDYER